jgi:predicted transcriptional regulator
MRFLARIRYSYIDVASPLTRALAAQLQALASERTSRGARLNVIYVSSATFAILAILTMAETSPKQLVLKAIEDLPADASIEDAMERLYFLAKVYRGLADAEAGRFVAHEEVKARFGLR